MVTSVIINTYHEKPGYLYKAIESYVNQTMPVEIIISAVNNDPNIPMIQKYANMIKDIPFKLILKPPHEKSPSGVYEQINNALPHLTGDWLCYASSNDYAEPDKIEREILWCQQYGKEVCYSEINEVTEDGQYILTRRFHRYIHERHLIENFVSDCSLLSRRLVDKYLPFRVEMKNYAYWDLWLRIYKGEGDVFCYLPHATWNYRRCSDSMHSTRTAEQQEQHDRDREMMLNKHR